MSLAHILTALRRRPIQTQDTAAPTTSVVKLIGPGLLVAAAGIGAGDIVSSTMAASAHGLQLLWVVALIIVRTFTIVGSLFIPFLAATLIYLNNFTIPPASGVVRNSMLTNIVLVFALALFAIVGASEAGLFR